MEILIAPNSILTTPSEKVEHFSSVAFLVEEMKQIGKENGLRGLAANQVGVLKQVFVLDMDLTGENPDWKEFINPAIIGVSVSNDPKKDREFGWEGCASIPGLACLVSRRKKIKISAYAVNGELFNVVLSGELAQGAQHEADHLAGILMTSKARERKVIKK